MTQPALPGMPQPPEPDPRLSSTAARTQRRRALLAAGVHPATGTWLKPGTTCGGCAHLWRKEANSGGSWWKCRVAATEYHDGPDMVASWPGCAHHQERQP